MRYAVTGAIASLALLGAVSVTLAQGRGDRGDRGGDRGGAASGFTAPQPSARAQTRAPRAQPSRERAASQQRFSRERQQSERRRAASRSAARSEARRREQRAEQQRSSVQRRAAERRQERSAEQRREVQRKQQSKTTQRPDAGAARQEVKRVEATSEQRTRVRERLFREHRGDRDRGSDRIRGIRPIVGVHIPRRHRLHRLPVWVVDYAPIYGGYSYVWVEDTICIVDPATYVIVDVLPASSQRAEIRDLTLTTNQMRFVYAEVPKDTPVDVRIRLALGAEIPRNVALYTFPDHVLQRIPKLEGYRYVIVEDDVVIVDPADYAVVLVISR